MTSARRSSNSGGEQITPPAEAATTASPTKKRGRPRRNGASTSSSPAKSPAKKRQTQPPRRRSTRIAAQAEDDDSAEPAAAEELELSTSGPKRTKSQNKQPKPTDSPLKTGLNPTVLDERRALASHSHANDYIADDRDGEEGEDDEERQAKQIVADDDDEVEDGQPEQADYDDVAAPPHDIHTAAVGEEAAQYPKDAEANAQIDSARSQTKRQRGAARDNVIDQPLHSDKQVDDAMEQEEAAAVSHKLTQQKAAHNGTAVHDAETKATAGQATTRGTATADAEGSVRAEPHDSSVKNVALIGSADNKADVIAQAMHDKKDEVSAKDANAALQNAEQAEQTEVPPPKSPERQTTDPTTIRRKFIDSLVETLSEQKPADVTDEQFRQIATAIEAAVYEMYGEANNEYRAKLRELVMDLKPTAIDAKVRERIIKGTITASELVKLNVREIGPPELQSERREAARENEHEHIVPESEKERMLFVYQSSHGQRPGDIEVRKLEASHVHRETGDTLAANDDLITEETGHAHEQAPISELTMPAIGASREDVQTVANNFIADQSQSSASPPEPSPDPNEHSIVGFTNAPDQSAETTRME